MGFSAYFNFLLFHCAFRNQPLLLKYFLVFKLGSWHFPCKRSIHEEKSELYTISADCLLLAGTSSRLFAVVQPGSGLFASLEVASKLQGLWAGPLEEGVVAHAVDSGRRTKQLCAPAVLSAFILVSLPFSWRGVPSRDSLLCGVLGHRAVASDFFLFILLHPFFCWEPEGSLGRRLLLNRRSQRGKSRISLL